ncbi:MAG: N-6 DNA methylase [Clostridiales bacterium]|nr:N-6 DNA methylase [Clostridiales bacterium]
MQGKYHVVVTNPPYMGIRGMNDNLADYLNTHYEISKHDLFTVFMDLARRMTMPGGYLALINQHSWMFLSSYQRFREEFAKKCCICSMLHLGSGVFWGNVGTIVQSTAFVARNMSLGGYRSVFFNLQGSSSSLQKNERCWMPRRVEGILCTPFAYPTWRIFRGNPLRTGQRIVSFAPLPVTESWENWPNRGREWPHPTTTGL